MIFRKLFGVRVYEVPFSTSLSFKKPTHRKGVQFSSVHTPPVPNIMTISNAYKNLQKQLLVNIKASTKKQNAGELKKKISLLKYQRTNALRGHQPEKIVDIDSELKELEKKVQDPEVEVDEKILKGLEITKNLESKRNIDHVNDVANYLSYQRTYQELIERYNPGLRASQDDIIRKTAHRVGFELPQEFNK